MKYKEKNAIECMNGTCKSVKYLGEEEKIVINKLQQENQQLKERYENLMCGYIFLNNRVKQGMSNENKNKCLIELGNQILRKIEKGDYNE